MRATVPTSASSGLITVSNAVGGAVSQSPFTVSTAPIVEFFSPFGGAPGVDVVINGEGLLGATAVRFGAVSAFKFSVTAATQMHATVPAGATNAPISVVTPQGTGTSAASFRATTAPLIIDFNPELGAHGSQVTLNGLNFTGTRSVLFNNVSAAFSVNAPTQISATVPSTAVSGPITVTTANGSDRTLSSFLVRTGKPVIVDFDPPAGGARTTVTIDGLDFTGTTAVLFNGAAALNFSVVADTQIRAVVSDTA